MAPDPDLTGAPAGAPDLALALLNTQGTQGGPSGDRLGTPVGLLEWLAGNGLAASRLVDLRAAPSDARVLLVEARRLRAHAAAAVAALAEGAAIPEEALYGIDRVLSSGRTSRRIVPANGRVAMHEIECSPSLEALLAPVALATATLLATADVERLRRCARPDCRAWFLDTSKGGRRKWCSMSTCGNRAKAAKHRRKRRLAPGV